jgi:hypothetical protein
MFHMLERRKVRRDELDEWLVRSPVMRSAYRRLTHDSTSPTDITDGLVARLIDDGLLSADTDGFVSTP